MKLSSFVERFCVKGALIAGFCLSPIYFQPQELQLHLEPPELHQPRVASASWVNEKLLRWVLKAL